MMKKALFIKRLAALLGAVIMLVSSGVTASAEDKQYPTDIPVEWFSPEALTGVEKEAQRLVIKIKINGEERMLSLTFPSVGGFRLYNENEGIFKPQALTDITYKTNADGTFTAIGGDGTAIVFNHLRSPWAFQVFTPKGQLIAQFGADQIFYGYNGGELKKVKLECGISENEIIYGLGERFGSFGQNGVKTLLWNQDAWSDEDSSYKNIPILHSSLGYMLYFNSTYAATADIGASDSEKWSLDFWGPKFDFYFFTGAPTENLGKYTALTGTPLLPEKWVYRYWSGASGQTWTSEGEENMLNKLRSSLSGYKKLGITDIAALYGEHTLQANIQAYNLLLPTKTRMLGWSTPFQSRLDMSYWVPSLSTDIADNELPAFKSLLNPWSYFSTDTMDYSHPNAVAVTRQRWKQQIKWGLKGLMIDYCEYVPEDVLAYNGMSGLEFHNFIAYSYAKTNYEAFKAELKDAGLKDDDFILFARNAAPGSQVYSAHFGGDQQGNFEGMKKAVTALLTYSTAGFSNWGTDIGGYGASESADVYMRWLQFGTFNPIMRLHGQGERDPWHFGDTASSTFVTHYWLRENLLDKIYSSAINANKTGRAIVQPMAVAFPARQSLLENADQYMFCDDLLFCAVTTGGAYYRTVELPQGDWTDLWTGKIYKGGKKYDVDAPQNYSPVFIRSGSVIPIDVAADTLNMFESMADGNSAEALLITAPNGSRTSEFWSDENTKTVYTSSVDGNKIKLSADKAQQAKVLIIPGLAVKSASIDGVQLPEVDSIPSEEGGIFIDTKNFRTVICTGKTGWSKAELAVKGELNEDLAAGKKITHHETRAGSTKAENILDNDISNNWVITDLDEAYFVVDLEKSYAVDRVTLKWNETYGKKYAVSVSSDGENWTEVEYIEDGDGMIDNVSFEAISARYVRISDIESNSGRNNCTIYGFSVFAADKLGKAPDMSEVEDETVIKGTEGTEDEVKWVVSKRKKKKNPIIIEEYYDPVFIIAVIAGCVIAAAGIAAVIIVLVRKRRKKAADTLKTAVVNEEAENKNDE